MAFCKKCGSAISNQEATCPVCGMPQGTQADPGGFLWGLLGCCIPIVGLVLYLVWHDTKPKTSKAAGIGALVCVGVYVLFYVLMFLAGFGTMFL